jgi:hypothetical protein
MMKTPSLKSLLSISLLLVLSDARVDHVAAGDPAATIVADWNQCMLTSSTNVLENVTF